MLICQAKKGMKSLGTIEKEIQIKDFNIKYNFRIQPVTNNEIIKIDNSEKGNFFSSIIPKF